MDSLEDRHGGSLSKKRGAENATLLERWPEMKLTGTFNVQQLGLTYPNLKLLERGKAMAKQRFPPVS